MDETPLMQVAFQRILDRIAKAKSIDAHDVVEMLTRVANSHIGDAERRKIARDVTWALFPELRNYIRD